MLGMGMTLELSLFMVTRVLIKFRLPSSEVLATIS